jgi:hypothetical protein
MRHTKLRKYMFSFYYYKFEFFFLFHKSILNDQDDNNHDAGKGHFLFACIA